MKAQRTYYAVTDQEAKDYIKQYEPDKRVESHAGSCECGETPVYDIYNDDNQRPETRIIVCESCHDNAMKIERI